MQNRRNLAASKGASLQLVHIIRGLQYNGHKVRALSLGPHRKILCTEDLSEVHYGELGISNLGSFKLFESSVRRIQQEMSLPYLGLFDSYRFYDACSHNLTDSELLHERYALFAIGTALASRRLKIPYVLSLDGDELLEQDYTGEPIRGIQRLIAILCARFTFRLVDAFTCVTQAAKNHFVSQWGISHEKITVIPNGVDTDFFHPGIDSSSLRSNLGLNGHLVVAFVGDFWPWHDIDNLIEAFSIVKKAIPKSKMLLVGDGVTKPLVERKVSEHNLDDAVLFIGRVDHALVPKYLSIADVAVVPIPKDAPNSRLVSPLKLYEYMAAGKAIVASNIGQTSDVICEGHNGILVEPSNFDELATAIIELLEDPNIRKKLGENAREQAIQQHSWREYVRQLESVYLSVL